jgi:hypothetical protein
MADLNTSRRYAVIDELKQLHSSEVLEPRMRDELTSDERKNALRYLMVLKQNNSGETAASRPKHKYICEAAQVHTVAFLITRVKKPDEYDLEKLRRVMRYLQIPVIYL